MESKEREEGWMKDGEEGARKQKEAKKGDRWRVDRGSKKEEKGRV